jgi:very-short-patch-repair endonuclease
VVRKLPADSRNRSNTDLARNLRKNASESELMLKRKLNRKEFGFLFRFQYPVKDFILDFYCPEAGLCVEVDGEQHDPLSDRARDLLLLELNIQTYRLASVDVWSESLNVHLEEIYRICVERSGRDPFTR